MGYTVGQFEKPVVDLNQASLLAGQKCKTWGYEGAEPFGGQTVQCGQTDGWGSCIVSNVSVEYQCTGGKSRSKLINDYILKNRCGGFFYGVFKCQKY